MRNYRGLRDEVDGYGAQILSYQSQEEERLGRS